MRLVVIFDDKPEMMSHRAQYEPLHLAYLEDNSKEILIGGGLKESLEDIFVGGMWVLEVESFTRAEEIIKNDPYYAPEFRSYKILLWGKAGNKDVIL